MEQEEKGIVAVVSVSGEEGSQVVVFWGGDWLGFCVGVDQDLVEPCSKLDWSHDGGGMLLALVGVGRREGVL